MPNFIVVLTPAQKFWKRVADLTRASALAQDLGCKRMWQAKLFELMQKQDHYDCRTIN